MTALRLRASCAAFVLGTMLASCASQSPPAPTPIVHTPTPPAAPPPPPPAPTFTATPGLTPRERGLTILKLLNSGQPGQARAELEQLLAEEPDNSLAKSLLDQIDKDPRLLLGEKNFKYNIQPGETLSILAERYLGDRFLFYALARYNDIDKPGSTVVGQTILIPGAPGAVRPSSTHRKAESESDVEALDARMGKKAAKTASAPPPVQAPKAARDVRRASALRSQALVFLNGGAPGKAVALLQEATKLDPDSAPIKRDLARAEQINAELHK
jgi:hypothetical protein